MRRLLGVLVVMAVAMVGVANADEFLFGFSSGSGSTQSLEVTTTAGVFTFDTFMSAAWEGESQGWWSPDGSIDVNSDGNDNYIVGTCCPDSDHNNFFTFALKEMEGDILSAKLKLDGFVAFSSSGLSGLTWNTFDVSTDPITLNMNDGTSTLIWADLGSGVSYGSFFVTTGDHTGTILEFDLNAAALAAIEDSEGELFSIGGTLGPVIPEPSSMTLLALGSMGILLWGRRRNKAD